jgi:hypothetical protein
MQGAYGGLIMIIVYGGGGMPPEEFFLITQDNLDILTQTSNRILVQE